MKKKSTVQTKFLVPVKLVRKKLKEKGLDDLPVTSFIKEKPLKRHRIVDIFISFSGIHYCNIITYNIQPGGVKE